MVRNLLGFARKEQYNFDRIDLNETIQSSLSLIQHELVSRPIHLSCDLQGNLPRIYASRDHLQGVWINIVMNAIDAMENGHGKIEVISRLVGGEFRVTIHDNGKGTLPSRAGLAHLRAVLHHQSDRPGDWVGAVRLPPHRQAARRLHPCGEPGR